ncbi:MAG TPA: alkaline phosphatase family protein, partial [Pyrinomonadaceae bacterium]|nr:alkaline phosphatase family protein [Pyrinomonadaceae bacterium]
QSAAEARPRLVLLIVVDQFRADFLERFGDLFAENGLGRLAERGASWANTHYDHTPTYTAPGHATLMTGTWPAQNGIVGNLWFDREAGRVVENIADPDDRPGQTRYQLIGGAPNELPASPRRLAASTVGDELRLTTAGRSKVIGISSKNRSAILPAGRHASAAYWFSTQTGRMVTSSYYFGDVPQWVKQFNESKPADKLFGAKWDYLLGSNTEYLRRAGLDSPPWENIGNARGDTNAFPHTLTGGADSPGPAFYGSIDYTPFGNDLLVEFARQAIDGEALGADADTDVLSVSFSANDYVGHRFGPYSHEAMDAALRVDRQIGALLDHVDSRVGLQNTLVAFTADHGCAPIPEHASALGLPGGRIGSAEILGAIRSAVRANFSKPNERDTTADYVLDSFLNANVFFNTAALARDRIDRREIERVAGEAALTVPGITRYFTRTQLLAAEVDPTDDIARRVLHGFHPRRSGDLLIVTEPYKYLSEGTFSIPATHGSPYSYDTHVPLMIMGAGVVPGRRSEQATPADLAPTLAALLRLNPPSNSTGRVLREAFAQR